MSILIKILVAGLLIWRPPFAAIAFLGFKGYLVGMVWLLILAAIFEVD